MKKRFTIPTIEKANFVLSDDSLCAINITSGVTSDYGVIADKVQSMTDNQTSTN